MKQLSIDFLDIELDQPASANYKQLHHMIITIEAETMAHPKYMQHATFQVSDINRQITLVVKQEDHQLQERAGSISFPMQDIYNAIGEQKHRLWVTLFDDIDDDLYDGNYMESDTENPRILVEFNFTDTADSPIQQKLLGADIDSLEKERFQPKIDSPIDDQENEANKELYLSNKDKKESEESLIEGSDEAKIRKELDDNLERQLYLKMNDTQPFAISNEQENTAISEIKSKITEISALLSANTLQQNYEEATNTILTLKQEISAYKEKTSKYENELKAVPAMVEQTNSLKKQLMQNEMLITKYKQSESNKNVEAKAKNEEIDKLEKEIITLRNTSQLTIDETKYKYESQIKDKEQSISDLQSQLRLKNAIIDEKVSEVTNCKQKLKNIEEEYAKAKSLNNELVKRLELSEQSAQSLKLQSELNLNEIKQQIVLIKTQYQTNIDSLKENLNSANKQNTEQKEQWRCKEEQLQDAYKELSAKHTMLTQANEEQRQSLEEKSDEYRAKADKIMTEKENDTHSMESQIQLLKMKLSQEDINSNIHKKIEIIIELLNKLLEGREAYLIIIKEAKEKNEQLQTNIAQLMNKHAKESEKNKKTEDENKMLHEKMLSDKQIHNKEIEALHKEIERLNDISSKTRNKFEELVSKIKEADSIHQKSKEKDEVIANLKRKIEEYEKILQKHVNTNVELAKENEILKGQMLFRDEKLKIYEKEASDKEKTLFIPESSDQVDQMLAYYINQAQCPIKISKVGDGHYMFGTKKIFAKILNDRLVIRVGGGFMMIDEFLSIYTAQELAKIEKEDQSRNYVPKNESLSAQKSLDYSGHASPMAVPTKDKEKRVPIRSRSPIGTINGTNRARPLNETEIKNIKQLAAPKTTRTIEKSINSKGSITNITTKKFEEIKNN